MITHKQLLKFDEDQRKLFDFMGIGYPYRRPKSQWCKKPDRTKILTLNDPHRPYQNPVVHEHIEAKEKDAGMFFCGGDWGDYYSKSRFRKTRHQKFSDELRSVFLGLEWASTHWQDVRIMIGNHDNRPEKHVVTRLNDSVDILIMTESNMLERLASHFDNIKIVGTQLDKTDINLTHLYQLGDIIFTHVELGLKQNSATLDRVENSLTEWSETLQLKPFRVIAQSHNHRGTKEEGRVTRFLLPTASNPFSVGFEYIYSSRMIGRPPVVGYANFYQSHGVTDTNRSQIIKFQVNNGKTQPL